MRRFSQSPPVPSGGGSAVSRDGCRNDSRSGCDHGPVTSWRDVEQAEPAFAQLVRRLFDAHRHKTIATLRADGSPRISGIEAAFEDSDLVFSSMPSARKGADLRRDPRFALHSATVDPVAGAEARWPGEAKISGSSDRSRTDHPRNRRRSLPRRYRGRRAYPPQRRGHDARSGVVDPLARAAKHRARVTSLVYSGLAAPGCRDTRRLELDLVMPAGAWASAQGGSSNAYADDS